MTSTIDGLQPTSFAPRIGTAGWTIPRADMGSFPAEGTHLERYAATLPAVEINSSFHRPHRRATYERWAASTPGDFRFSVKIPKTISHVQKLVAADALLETFAGEVGGLGAKLGVILVQLPLSLQFDRGVASKFFAAVRRRFGSEVGVACEPRHATWFAADADACLIEHRVARVAADPVLAPGGEDPGGWPGLRYHRLHGSPRVYHSAYERPRLEALAGQMTTDVETWCIFDNTASGAATGDALCLQSLLVPLSQPGQVSRGA
nr:DUF72 domain-containing protein [Polymorphobacter sp.]